MTGTIKGRVVAKDGTSQLTGINVIARRVGAPFDATSRISGDLTQGLLGPDGTFVMTGLTPGANYLVYIDEIGGGGFSTPKATLLGTEEYWNEGESADATQDDACASSPITLAAGETRQITIAMNGIARAPTFTHIPYTLPSSISDNGQRIAGVYAPSWGPNWLWDKKSGASYIGGFGSGIGAMISGNGRVVGAGVAIEVEQEWGTEIHERAALWTKEGGWKKIANESYEGCGPITRASSTSTDGSTAVGLAFVDCGKVYPFRWTAKTGMKTLPKSSEGAQCTYPDSDETYPCDGAARANAVSGNGNVIGGWEEIPELGGFRVASIWQGTEQMLLRDPAATMEPLATSAKSWASTLPARLRWACRPGRTSRMPGNGHRAGGVTNLGRYPAQVCFFDWWSGAEICEDRDTSPSPSPMTARSSPVVRA